MAVFGPEVALLIVDMVDDFVSSDGMMYVPGAEEIVPPIKRMAEEARSSEAPVIYICDSHETSDADPGAWPSGSEVSMPETEIVSLLSPAPSDFVVMKYQYSSPFTEDLDILLKELGIKKVVLTGAAVDVCIYFVAWDAHKKGYQIAVPGECVVALSEGDKEASLQQMEQLFNAEII